MRNKNIEDAYRQVKRDLEEARATGKKKECEIKDLKSALSEVNRHVVELNEKNEDIENELKQQNSRLRVAKAHIESLVKVTTSILEHIVTKCQIHVNDRRSRS